MKRILSLAVCALMGACLSACGGNAAQVAANVGCVTAATTDAIGDSVPLNSAQKTALAAGQAVALVYCQDGSASTAAASAPTGASAPAQ